MFIDIDARKPLELIANLDRKLSNPKPLMQEIAGVLEFAIEENFRQEGRPDWVDLQPATKERRNKKGKWPGKILQVDGALAASITTRATETEAAAGTNFITAATHQFGAKKGEYGQTKYGVPIPFGDIPARPFLSLGDDDIQEIDEIIGDYLDI